jgi:glycosyltransferase involved in cell wall biosynthesis
MNKDISALYILPACCDAKNIKWFSPGRARKSEQLVNSLIRYCVKVKVLSTLGDERSSGLFSKQCIGSFNPFKRVFSILIGLIRISLFERKQYYYQYIICYNTRCHELITSLCLYYLNKNQKLILQIEDITNARENRWIQSVPDRIIEAIAFNFVSHVITPSKLVCSQLSKLYPNLQGKIFVYPPSLREDYLKAVEKRKHPFSGNITRILFMGGSGSDKGLLLLIKAYEKVVSMYSSFELHICGSTPIEISYYSNISVIPHGFVPREKLLKLIMDSDIIVNPHLPISNSNYIFPFKNIEIFGSGSFPLVSNIPCNHLDYVPKDFYFSDEDDLYAKIISAKSSWQKLKHKVILLSSTTRQIYSEANVTKNIAEFLHII